MLILSQHLWQLLRLLSASAMTHVHESDGMNARTYKDNAERRENESGSDNSSAKCAINRGSKYWWCKPSGGIIQNYMALLRVYHSGLNRCQSTSNKVFVNRLSGYIPASLVWRSPMSVHRGNEEIFSERCWYVRVNCGIILLMCVNVSYILFTHAHTLWCVLSVLVF